jgi:hypothetical protein
MNILDTIQADQIENGDQIIVDGEVFTNVTVHDSEDVSEVLVHAYSEDEGDFKFVPLPYDYYVDVWAL